MNSQLTTALIAKEALRMLSERLTFASERIPDTRKWPRFKAWILRRPTPMIRKPQPMPEYTPNSTIKIGLPNSYSAAKKELASKEI